MKKSFKNLYLNPLLLSNFDLSKLFCQLLITSIKIFRPLLGPTGICPFEIGCTEYAILQLKTQPLYKALWNSSNRLLSCNPLSVWFKKKANSR